MPERPPERFEDLPPELQEKLRRVVRPVDLKRARVRAARSLYSSIAAAVLVFLPGAWLVSAFAAPVSIVNAVLSLREMRGVADTDDDQGRAWAGLAISVLVLAYLALHARERARTLAELLHAAS